jgi:glutathione S-transferase
MNETIVFYHNPMSRGQIVHWMLEESGAPYETKILDFDKREHKSPEYRAINPMGKVPAIVHRGVVVTEAAAMPRQRRWPVAQSRFSTSTCCARQ